MATYSHSRITTYENCPYQYKLRYIEKKKPEVPTTIEAFMGDMVHQTLEHLYKLKNFKKRVALNVLIKFYSKIRPFGFWKPVREEAVRRGLVPVNDKMPMIDFSNGILSALFQLSLSSL